MNRNMVMATLAVCLMWPVGSQAQGRPRVRVESGPYGVFSFSDNRGRIGVIVDTRANTAGDKVGARIEGITPGGPAEKAGLKAGDVITRFKGTALGGVAAEDGEDSGPGMKLIALARELDPGDTVQVEYRRGTEAVKKLTLVAENLGGDFERIPGMGAMRGLMGPEWHVGPGSDFELAFRTPWGGIELVKLNPELGEYFGTREGVLVVSTPDDSSLALKGGDVILTIGGRKPSSPMQAMRILRTYEPGESVAIEVMRKQKRVAVTWKVPEHERGLYKMPGMHEEPSGFRWEPKVRKDREALVRKIRDVVRTI
jgi:C-terminal processing protease CtpA/Prc